MGGRRRESLLVLKSYSREATLPEIRVRILKLLLEDRERGITAGAVRQKGQHRDLCEAEQG